MSSNGDGTSTPPEGGEQRRSRHNQTGGRGHHGRGRSNGGGAAEEVVNVEDETLKGGIAKDSGELPARSQSILSAYTKALREQSDTRTTLSN